MVSFNPLKIKESSIKLLLCFLAIISFFSTINNLPPLDRDESRYIQATSQMLETKDFLNIYFLDTPRLKKPPGTYWIQSLSATIVKNLFLLEKAPLWSYRLPSALALSISLWVIYLLGKLLFGRIHGLVAALLFLSSPLVMIESNIAKTDSLLCCFVLISIYFFSKEIFREKDKEEFNYKYLFFAWVALSFSVLIKGPIPLFIILSLIICFHVFDKDFNFKVLKPVYGFISLIIITLPWFLYIYVGDNSGYLIESFNKDFLSKITSAQESHGAPPGSYLLSLFVTSWPMALFLFPTLIWTYLNRKSKSVLFLLCALLPGWLLFEFIPTKLLHYTLPLLPFLALLISAMFIDLYKNTSFLKIIKKNYIRILQIFSLLSGLIIPCIMIYFALKYDNLSIFIIFSSVIFILATILSFYYFFKGHFSKTLIISSIGTVIAIKIFLIFVPNQIDDLWVSEKIFEKIKDLDIKEPIILLGYSEPSLVYRLGSKTQIAGSSEEASNLILKKNMRYIIVEKQYIEKFKNISYDSNFKLLYVDNYISGYNYSKGKKVEIGIFNIIFK